MKFFSALTILALGLSFAGFLVASYLTIQHYMGNVVPCSVLHGCEIVTTSVYSEIWGIPISLGGSLYFIAILFSALAFWSSNKKIFLNFALILSSLGFIAALGLFYLQFFVLDAICIYCATSDTISILLFIVILFMVKLYKKTFV